MSEMDREDEKEAMKMTIKLIAEGYRKVSGILDGKADMGEIRGFMVGCLIEESDVNFELFISLIKNVRNIIKSDTHE